ncbi:hypothetical protein TNIN_193921 [Trichonephila inaurata madagascariensis]|uniref:Secreted protein n=1 Tax=Trichonephila inaurata madagascariensis TaxID=2747483 RepID=A0A8X7C471_9ARAC|nr:hypothetical protein TNIN_193921 [Trichonephila inaurata madagascariensis]
MDPFCLIVLMPVLEIFLSTSLQAEIHWLCDGGIAAPCTSLYQLQYHLEKFTRAVVLRGSRAALLSIVSDTNSKTVGLLDCRHHLKKPGIT